MCELVFTAQFDRLFRGLPKAVKETTYAKLALLAENPNHPSLRVKRVRGSGGVWEMSVTMNYRVTFEIAGEMFLLRRIGTHDVLRNP